MRKLFFLFLSIVPGLQAAAEIKLPRLISDGMVLQRGNSIPVWGWADAGEKVSLTFKGMSYQTIADIKGKWMLRLPSQQAGGPFQMIFRGNNEIRISDILIGDVWLCSGQSNMELPMERVKYRYADEMDKVNYPRIRQFTVPDKYDFNQASEDLEGGRWVPATRTGIFEFSAVAYFFAKELYTKFGVPIGLINAALGGSPAEAWISEEGLKKFPAYYQEALRYRDNNLIRETENRDNAVRQEWYRALNEKDQGLRKNWRIPEQDEAGWKSFIVPGYWADTDAGPFNGSAWFRKSFNVPPSMAGKPAKLELGRIVDADSVFINGQFAGYTSYQYPPRRYILPATLLKEGSNHIVIRVINQSGKGGFVPDKRYELTTPGDTISLAGKWLYREGARMPALPGNTVIRWKPMGLYNAMIAPLINYPIKGMIWYQGESNASRPSDYFDLMKTLVTDWRMKWHKKGTKGPLPFLFVQLANFMETKPLPQESGWAALRQQQWRTLSVPNTGMAVAIDAGEWNDIHPENKKDIGYRLALQARRIAYGEKTLVASGPMYKSMKKEGNKIVLTFTSTGSGLLAKDNPSLQHFAIAGADNKYQWARAEIRGNTVVVWHDAIPDPKAVRYGWADNPAGANLYNKEGLPASPFGTND